MGGPGSSRRKCQLVQRGSRGMQPGEGTDLVSPRKSERKKRGRGQKHGTGWPRRRRVMEDEDKGAGSGVRSLALRVGRAGGGEGTGACAPGTRQGQRGMQECRARRRPGGGASPLSSPPALPLPLPGSASHARTQLQASIESGPRVGRLPGSARGTGSNVTACACRTRQQRHLTVRRVYL